MVVGVDAVGASHTGKTFDEVWISHCALSPSAEAGLFVDLLQCRAE
jgi:hypothetical protein